MIEFFERMALVLASLEILECMSNTLILNGLCSKLKLKMIYIHAV